MNKIVKPNWSNSILNVTTSILKHYGYNSSYPTIPLLDEELEKDKKNIILLLLDGLGNENLEELSPKGILSRNKKMTLTSTFPSTTVAATSSVESGVTPLEHGWLGWSLYFKEFDRNIDIFPYRDSITKEEIPLTSGNGKEILRYKSVYDKIYEKNGDLVKRYSFHPEKINHDFTSCINKSYGDISDMFDKLYEVCQEDGKKYIYAYSANPDYDMHEFGSNNPKIKKDIFRIEKELKKFVKKVDDTLVIVIADHGHIDVEWVYISEIPGMKECLKRFPTIEGRARNISLNAGKEEEFLEIYKKYLKNDFVLYSKKEILEENFFGLGKKHFKFDDFIDDYMLCAIGNKCLGYELPKEEDFIMKSTHAGLTEREMIVPLIIIEK